MDPKPIFVVSDSTGETAERVVRALREKDVTTLMRVGLSLVGRTGTMGVRGQSMSFLRS